MKKYILFIFVISLFLFSCKKEKDDPISKNNNAILDSYMPLAVGNYWIYQSVMVDTNGIETINPKLDSVYVSSDTLINGKLYYHIWGLTFFNYPTYNYYARDSSEFFVGLKGALGFAPNYYKDTLINTVPNYYINYRYSIPKDTLITVPAGIFLTSLFQSKFVFTPTYQWEKVRYMPQYFSRGIGIVKERAFFTGNPNYYEGRLLRYHLYH